jgi:hypothetical protein
LMCCSIQSFWLIRHIVLPATATDPTMSMGRGQPVTVVSIVLRRPFR